MSVGSPLIKAMAVLTSGVQAQDKRMMILGQNLANAGSRASSPGESPYQRQTISMRSKFDRKLGVSLIEVNKIGQDTSPFPRVHSPGDPGADQDGYVLESNANPMIEMADMRQTNRNHEAIIRSMEKVLGMLIDTINLLKPQGV